MGRETGSFARWGGVRAVDLVQPYTAGIHPVVRGLARPLTTGPIYDRFVRDEIYIVIVIISRHKHTQPRRRDEVVAEDGVVALEPRVVGLREEVALEKGEHDDGGRRLTCGVDVSK